MCSILFFVFVCVYVCLSTIYMSSSWNELSTRYKKIPLQFKYFPDLFHDGCEHVVVNWNNTYSYTHTFAFLHALMLLSHSLSHIFMRTHQHTRCPTVKTMPFSVFLLPKRLFHIFLSCEYVHNMRSDHDRFGIFCWFFCSLHFYVFGWRSVRLTQKKLRSHEKDSGKIKTIQREINHIDDI